MYSPHSPWLYTFKHQTLRRFVWSSTTQFAVVCVVSPLVCNILMCVGQIFHVLQNFPHGLTLWVSFCQAPDSVSAASYWQPCKQLGCVRQEIARNCKIINLRSQTKCSFEVEQKASRDNNGSLVLWKQWTVRTSGLAFGSSLSQHRRPGEGAGICIGETGEQGGGCEKTNTTDFVSSCHAYRVRISPHDNILECKQDCIEPLYCRKAAMCWNVVAWSKVIKIPWWNVSSIVKSMSGVSGLHNSTQLLVWDNAF